MTALFPTSLHAQTQKQKALVRTRVSADMKGGDPIPGAEVKLKGGNRYTSDTNGMFSFPVRGNFEIESAHKDGYVMIDPKYLKNFTSYSNNAIPVIMEERRKLNRETEKQVRRMTEELSDENERLRLQNDSLFRANAINEARYDSLESVRNNDYLGKIDRVREMAEELANIDYAILKEFDRQFYAALSEGDYPQVYRLLNSRKNVDDHKKEIAELNVAIQAYDSNIASIQKIRDTAIYTLEEKIKAAAETYDYWFEFYKARFMNDSAAFWLEEKVALDSTNIEWLNQAAWFLVHYLSDFDKGDEYFRKGLIESHTQFGGGDEWTASFYHGMGDVASRKGLYALAMRNFKESLKIYKHLYGEKHPDVADAYNVIGVCFEEQGEYKKALKYFNKALKIFKWGLGEGHLCVATTYMNIGAVFCDWGKYDIAMEYHLKAFEILKNKSEDIDDLANVCDFIGDIYLEQGKTDQAMEFLSNSLTIRRRIFGDEHPETALSFNNIAGLYSDLGENDTALVLYNRALDIWNKTYGTIHPLVATALGNIGAVYADLGDYPKAVEFVSYQISILKRIFGEKHPGVAMSYNNLGMAYYNMDENTKALDCFNKAYEISKKISGKNSNTILYRKNAEMTKRIMEEMHE